MTFRENWAGCKVTGEEIVYVPLPSDLALLRATIQALIPSLQRGIPCPSSSTFGECRHVADITRTLSKCRDLAEFKRKGC